MFAIAYDFLAALGDVHIVDLFFISLILDIPRYLLGFLAVLLAVGWASLGRRTRRSDEDFVLDRKVSILLPGYNEEDTIERCIRSLHEQSYRGEFEIICVDDGSTDNAYAIMRRLEQEGLVARAIRLDLRSGKAAATNLSASLATGDILVAVDADCSFDRHALREILRPFHDDPEVGAVCGNILVRNWRDNLVTSLQQIEYLITISLGKTLADTLGQVTCISGAFGAFRRDAWDAVGGLDVGPGEDFDVTFRLRLAGYRTRFARLAICYTDAPDTLRAFSNQRARWERDSFWIRFRKFGYTFDPTHQRFRLSELVNQLDFVAFTLLPAIVFPFYLLYLVLMLPGFAPVLILAISIALAAIDMIALLLALLLIGRTEYWSLVLVSPLSGIFQAYLVRLMRLRDYTTEFIFSRSLDDNYVPQKVRLLSTWR